MFVKKSEYIKLKDVVESISERLFELQESMDNLAMSISNDSNNDRIMRSIFNLCKQAEELRDHLDAFNDKNKKVEALDIMNSEKEEKDYYSDFASAYGYPIAEIIAAIKDYSDSRVCY